MPTLAEALSNLGFVCKRQGQLEEAERCYRHALRGSTRARNPLLHCNLGLTLLLDQRRLVEASVLYRRRGSCSQARPGRSRIATWDRVSCGKADWTSAVASCSGTALGYQPGERRRSRLAGAPCNCSAARTTPPRWPVSRPLRLKPDHAEVHWQLGVDPGVPEPARRRHRQLPNGHPAEARPTPKRITTWSTRGSNDSRAIGEQSLASYGRALQLQPDYAEAHVCRALVWLLTQNFARRLPEYEWQQRKLAGTAPQSYPQPLWDGSPLAGRTILLHAEQGLGDTLQCIRYAPQIKQRGGKVLLGCQPPPARGRLLARCLVGRRPSARSARARCRPSTSNALMLELPGVFHTTLDNIPAQVPYLFPADELVERWRRELASDGRFKVGVAWRGNLATSD